jgi:heme-degrading monooxygenase HmoA
MIERHVTFHVLPDKGEEFARFFEQEYRPAMAKTKGFVKAELLQDAENEKDYMMILRFESLESAAAWRESDIHQKLKPNLKSLYQGSELIVLKVIVQE